MDKEPNRHLGARLLIIIYALGIIAIGAYPIQQQHGGLFEYVKAQTMAFAGEMRSPTARRPSTVDLPAMRTLSPAPRNKEQPMDGLTKEDRRELNSLIDDL